MEIFYKSWQKLSEVSELNGYSRDYTGLGVEAVTTQNGEILLNILGIELISPESIQLKARLL